MLQCELTKRRAGVILWGDTWSLRASRGLVFKINDESALIEQKEGFLLGLAYDLRKAYEGQRRKDVREYFEDRCPVYGVEILWPMLIAQIGTMRAAMAYIRSTRADQMYMYELEWILEQAFREMCPGQEHVLMQQTRQLGTNPSNLQRVLPTRCLYFINLPPRQRPKMLPLLVTSMLPNYRWVAMLKERTGAPFIPLEEFERLEGLEDDWPDFKW